MGARVNISLRDYEILKGYQRQLVKLQDKAISEGMVIVLTGRYEDKGVIFGRDETIYVLMNENKILRDEMDELRNKPDVLRKGCMETLILSICDAVHFSKGIGRKGIGRKGKF